MEAQTVRAWGGTICVISDPERYLYCRGSNATGLLIGEYDSDGWARVADLDAIFHRNLFFSIEGGEGVLVLGDVAFVWGGPNGTGVIRLLPGDVIGGIGDGSRRFATTVVGGESTLRTWGAPHPTLSTVPWTDNVIGASRRIMQTVEAELTEIASIGCYGEYCCANSSIYPLRALGRRWPLLRSPSLGGFCSRPCFPRQRECGSASATAVCRWKACTRARLAA